MAKANNELRLEKFTAESFANIDKSQPLVLVFPESGGVLVEFSGNQEVGKSSALSGLDAAFGGELVPNAVNNVDNTIKEELLLSKSGKKYKVILSKNRYELSTLIDDKWATINSPKAMIRDLIGPVAHSPMFLKDYDGKKQIEWLRSFFNLSAEQLTFEKDLDLKIKTAYTDRRNVNRDLKKVTQDLQANSYYVSQVEWEKKIKEFKPGDAKKKIDDVTKRHTEYSNSIAAVKRLREERVPELNKALERLQETEGDLKKQLAELQARIEQNQADQTTANNTINEVKERIVKGDKYLADNIGVLKEFADISKITKEHSEMAVHKQNYSNMLLLQENSNALHKEYTRLENLYDESKELKKKFIAEFTPNVKGLEVFIGDEEDPREGIFYKQRPMSEISESEMWELMTLLLQKLKVKVLMVENISSLGTGAIDIFNKFIKSGGYIFASQMDRSIDELKVSFYEKID